MKLLVIPDVHLKPHIIIRAKELLKEGVADNSVCLMDIPDDWQKQFLVEEYIKTFDEAIAFAKEFPNSLWVYGNHDVSYLWNEHETGFSTAAKHIVQGKLMELSAVLGENNPIRFIQKVDNCIFVTVVLQDISLKNMCHFPSMMIFHMLSKKSIPWGTMRCGVMILRCGIDLSIIRGKCINQERYFKL